MPFDIRFKGSFNCIVAGASGSGKTTFVKNLLLLGDQLFTSIPDRVFLFYSNKQPIYDEMLKQGLVNEVIDANETFPTAEYLTSIVRPYKNGNGSLIILDDIMSDISLDFVKIFCNLSHHEKASIIFMTQNLFYNNKIYRTLSLNTHYIILMKNDRDRQQISFLGRQVCPSNPSYIVQSYSEATKRPYEYLILDFRVDTPSTIKLRSHIFPHQFPVRVYVEN